MEETDLAAIETSEADKRRSHYVMFIILITGLGGLLYGFSIGVISGALVFFVDYMKQFHNIVVGRGEQALIVAVFLGGCAVAALVSGVLADRFGRRLLIGAGAIIFIAGTIVASLATSFAVVTVGRFIQGLAVGVVTFVIPLYLAEISPKKIRGRGVVAFQLLLTFGVLMGYIVNTSFAHMHNLNWNWRLMFLCVIIPAIPLVFAPFFIPGSPKWLFLKGKKEQALASLRRTHPDAEVKASIEEMEKLEAAEEEEKAEGKKKHWQKHYLRPVLLAMGIVVLLQLTGINNYLQYAARILDDAGFAGGREAMITSVIFGLVNFFVTALAVYLIDRSGRRPLLLGGSVIIMASLVFTGLCFALMGDGVYRGIAVVIGLIVFLVGFAVGPGAVCWLIAPEILPLPIRSKGVAVATFLNALVPFLYSLLFLGLIDWISYDGVFWLSAGFTLLLFLLVKFLLPETRGESLENIEMFFIKKAKGDKAEA